jgi:hypothetical protein
MNVRKTKLIPLARLSLALILGLDLAACADSPMGTVQRVAVRTSVVRETPADAQAIAKGLALAMRDQSVRGQVHAAMRGSSFNEHKLVLQDFATTAVGEKVLAAVSTALGQSLSATKAQVASLPAIDFYLPFEPHRQTWKATADVYVATTFDKRAPSITAYGSNGRVLELRQADGLPPVPLIILHPAEPKTRSMPVNSAADLIENPPTVASTSLARNDLISCGDSCGGGGGGGGGCCSMSTPPGTYITHFNIKATDGWFGSSEMVFYGKAIAGNFRFVPGSAGTNYLVADYLCDKGVYAQSGVNTSQGYDGLFPISPTVVKGAFLTCSGYSARYAVHIMESDGGLYGKDDDYGWRIYAPGYYPGGTTYDVVYSYYNETYPVSDDNRSAYLKISIY